LAIHPIKFGLGAAAPLALSSVANSWRKFSASPSQKIGACGKKSGLSVILNVQRAFLVRKTFWAYVTKKNLILYQACRWREKVKKNKSFVTMGPFWIFG
jgi:hypothetical protein